MKLSRPLLATAATTALAVGLLPAATAAAQPSAESSQAIQTYLVVRDLGAPGAAGRKASPATLARSAGGTEIEALDAVGAALVEMTPAEAADLAGTPGLVVTQDAPIGIPESGWSPVDAGEEGLGAAAKANSWGLDRVDQRRRPLNGKYKRRPGINGAGVHVFVFDSGLTTGHPEFRGRVGWGYTTIGSSVQDCNGHGTHVAGTVASTKYGVAPKATVHPIRVLDCGGGGSTAGFIRALNYVASRAPVNSVANASLGGPADASVNLAVDNFVRSGTPLVAAAGNSFVDAGRTSPAGATLATTVAATTKKDRHASYSNWGSRVELYAPGSLIRSTHWANSRSSIVASGTSMAAPHVAGFMALYLDRYPTATAASVRAAAMSKATAGVVATSGGTPDRLVHTYRIALPQRVVVKPVNRRSRLRVNLNPNVAGAWTVKIQKKVGKGFRTVKTVRTRQRGDKVTVELGRGRYRARVPGQFGYRPKTSKVVRIVR